MKEAGKKVGKKLGERAEKVGNAMLDASLLSVGAIGISKLEKKLATDENASEAEKNRNKILLDTATAGIKAATGSVSGNNGSSSNKGGNVGKEVTDKLGAPTHKTIDTSGSEYQNLMNSTTDSKVKENIRSLRKQGYDIDQLQKYVNEINHAEFAEWNESFVFSEFRW